MVTARQTNQWKSVWLPIAAALISLGSPAAVSCRPVTNAFMVGRTAPAANDQLMLIRETPETFGFRRLSLQASLYPDLREFLRQEGLPDFMAESRNGDRRYLILYFLDRRQAFACRAKAPATGSIEFAGPYPITDGEVELLSGYRANANAGPASPGS